MDDIEERLIRKTRQHYNTFLPFNAPYTCLAFVDKQ